MRQISFVVLCVFMFTVPWESLVLLPGARAIPRMIGLIALGVGLVDVLARRRVRRPDGVFLLAVLFVCWAAASVFWTIDLELTWRRVWTYVQLLGMTWLILEYGDSQGRRRALIQAYILGALLAGAFTLQGFLVGRAEFGYEERYTAGLFDPNELGITMAMAIPFAWFLGTGPGHRTLAWVNRAAVPFLTFAVLLTASRAAFVCVMVAASAPIWTATDLRTRYRWLLAFLAPILVYVIWLYVPGGVQDRLATLGPELGSMNNRVEIWRVGLQVSLDSPILGIGAGAFPTAADRIMGLAYVTHNTFLSTYVELGLVGFLLFMTLLLQLLIVVVRLSGAERKIWLIVTLTWALGALTLSWDFRKTTWLLFGLVAARAASTGVPPSRDPTTLAESTPSADGESMETALARP